MGTSTSWIAVEGASLDQVTRELGLSLASSDSAGPTGDGGYEVAVLPTGWVLLVRRMERNGVVADPVVLRNLSRLWRVVGCDEETHVMHSASSEWRKGGEVWALVHSSEEAAAHLGVRGEPPADWQKTRDKFLAKHAAAEAAKKNVDYVFEIPLVVADLVVGYRLDSDEAEGLEFVSFVPVPPPQQTPPSAKPWWRFW
jgi:hypothetical protein